MTVDTGSLKPVRSCAIAIPALNPPESFVGYVDELWRNGFHHIIVVDDGSDAECQPVFDELISRGHCEVYRHAVNMGTGRTTKDALNHYLTRWAESCPCGVVTTDCDGQHLICDVIRVCGAMEHGSSDSLYFGVRDFNEEGIPSKSRFGNKCTNIVVRLLYGGHVSDTQTGLRGYPRDILPDFIDLRGERFEYLTNVLIVALQRSVPIVQVPIATVYLDQNKSTTFHAVKDSFKIYKLIFGTFFKFMLSSLGGWLVDIVVFALAVFLLGQFGVIAKIWIATIVARVFSTLCNYLINKNVVFKKNNPNKGSFWKYYALAVAQLCCSAMFVSCICVSFNVSEVLAKVIVDTLLFFVSFQVQRLWVFRAKPVRNSKKNGN